MTVEKAHIKTDPVPLQRIEELAMELSVRGIATLADLKRCIGRDPDEGISWVATKSNIPCALLASLLIAELTEDADKKDDRPLVRYWRPLKSFAAVWSESMSRIKEVARKGNKNWPQKIARLIWVALRQSLIRPQRHLRGWQRHWFDALVFAILPLLILGFALRAHAINQRLVGYVAVRRGASVPAFQKLANQVELRNDPGLNGAFTSIDQVSDRYAFTPISGGTVLQSDQLLSAELSARMPNRKIFTIPIKSGAYNPAMPVPTEALLILSARQPDAKGTDQLSIPVIVLRIQNEGDARAVTFAVMAKDFEPAATLLASRDAFVVQTVP